MVTDARTEPQVVKRQIRFPIIPVLGLTIAALLLVWLVVNLYKTPDLWLQAFLIGVTRGSIYALIALGYTLVYGILELINFAHGDVFMLGGMISITMIGEVFGLKAGDAALTIWPAIIATLAIAMVGCGLINTTVERIAYKPLRGAPRLVPLITAIAMSFILQNIAIAWKGSDYAVINSGTGRSGAADFLPQGNIFTFGIGYYSWPDLIVVLLTAPVLLALIYFVQRTRQGKAMRATAQDREAAAMMGIDVNRTISFTFLIAGGLAGVGRADLRSLLHRGQVRPGLPARPDRVHRSRAGRNRQPSGRRARRDLHRADPGVQQHPHLACAGRRLDPVDRLRDPDPHPRLPSRGSPRRTDTGRGLTCRTASVASGTRARTRSTIPKAAPSASTSRTTAAVPG